MNIKVVDNNSKSDIDQFIKFPFDLYRECPQWVPTMSSELTAAMDKKSHPFYEHSDAAFLIAESEGQTLGRLAVIHNQNFCNYHNESVAFFYYFESINDQQVSHALFETAFDWARKRNIKKIKGPKGMLRSNGLGILVEGFDYLPAMGIPYNYSYFQDLIESIGFQKTTDHLSGFMDASQKLPEKLYQIAEKVKEKNRFWIKTFTSKKEMEKWIPLVNTVHHEAFKNNPDYYPSTDKEFELLAKTMIQIMDPKLVKLIMKEDELAGFIITYADISRGLQKAKGQIWPTGWIHLLQEKKQTRKININGLGLLPKFQGLGANALLYTELEKTVRSSNFTKAEIVQVDERNFLSKSDMNTLGTNWNKRHRTYELILAER